MPKPLYYPHVTVANVEENTLIFIHWLTDWLVSDCCSLGWRSGERLRKEAATRAYQLTCLSRIAVSGGVFYYSPVNDACVCVHVCVHARMRRAEHSTLTDDGKKSGGKMHFP